MCCKFNRLLQQPLSETETEIETMRLLVQVNWSIKDCRNSFAWQASHLRLLRNHNFSSPSSQPAKWALTLPQNVVSPYNYYDDDDVVERNELLRKISIPFTICHLPFVLARFAKGPLSYQTVAYLLSI